jgi:hypothetical protein
VILSYLGYPSTSGDLADALAADRWCAPPEAAALYTEPLALLPRSYFVNDHRQLYPRAAEGGYPPGPPQNRGPPTFASLTCPVPPARQGEPQGVGSP